MAVTIRRVNEQDAGRLKAVRLSALADSPFAFGSTLEREVGMSNDDWSERTRSSSAGPARTTFIAQDSDDVVGLVGGYREDRSSGSVELVSMWVDPRYRRQGLGRMLVDEVVRWGADHGASSIGLWVTRGNESAERLYRALGFTTTEQSQPLPSDPCREEMRRALDLTVRGAR